MTFSHIGTHLPKFASYLNAATADDVLRPMIQKKKGKPFVKFYKDASHLRQKTLKDDQPLKTLLERAVALQDELKKKAEHKFEKLAKKVKKEDKKIAKKAEK